MDDTGQAQADLFFSRMFSIDTRQGGSQKPTVRSETLLENLAAVCHGCWPPGHARSHYS